MLEGFVSKYEEIEMILFLIKLPQENGWLRKIASIFYVFMVIR